MELDGHDGDEGNIQDKRMDGTEMAGDGHDGEDVKNTREKNR